MSSQEDMAATTAAGSALPWILEHLLTYPGTYELPLRTMYTLNCASLSGQPSSGQTSPVHVSGNAFPSPTLQQHADDQQQMSTATAAAQLKANLMTHISQLSSQPASLPPSFITSFVRKCFTVELDRVDFPQSLTAMDYLKDLEIRRRCEVVSALDKLGIDKGDIVSREQIAKKYPGVVQWLEAVEEKERKMEALYSQVYVGLRRWTLINEMSLVPFNKANCIAMLNTLYPPMGISSSQFVQPTAQLTAQILSEQRNGFFRYITAVEKKGPGVLSALMQQHKRPGDETAWPSLQEGIDNYLRMANSIIEECYEISGQASPTGSSFSVENDQEQKRKVDSGISFSSSGGSSNRNSGQSHSTRPSTSSSISNQSRRASRDKQMSEKQLPEKPLPVPTEETSSPPPSPKPAGSTLERIARELRKIRSRSNVKEESKARPATSHTRDPSLEVGDTVSSTGKTLRLKRSLMKMRSNGGLREGFSRPTTSEGSLASHDVPAFDAEEMRLKRQAWEASQPK